MHTNDAGRRLAFCAATCIVAAAASAIFPTPAAAQDPSDSFQHVLVPLQDQPAETSQPANNTAMNQPSNAATNQPAAAALDPGLVSVGEAAFMRSCTSCHDAQRSLQKSKSFGSWLTTVQRMASKDGADVSSADYNAIATYLTSVTGGASGGATGGDSGSAWSFATTVSTIYRTSSGPDLLENPGFFPDVWVTAAYQSSGPLRATVTACTSCHSRDNGLAGTAYSIELVEGSATLDLRQMCHGCKCDDGYEMLFKAGRFIVPFGAFSSMANPSTYRTATMPLMFNMGRRVFVPGWPPRQPVLPAPFADEGLDFIYRAPVLENILFTFDGYAINGLQGTGPDIFNRSRAYFDNNADPSGGARMTLGGDFFRLGTSVLSGNLANQNQPHVYYTLAGADATAQLTDRLRFYFEYAMRRQDSAIVAGTKETTSGTVTQLELRVWDQPYIGVLVRYDTLDHRSIAFGPATINRITEGLNIGLPGGSLLMVNHERWWPKGSDHQDVLAIRWAIAL